MNQFEWIDLLKQDQLLAASELLSGHVAINPCDVKRPSIFLRSIIPKTKRNRSSEILTLLDLGLSQWFISTRNRPLPQRSQQFLFVVRIWDAFDIVSRLDLPNTTHLLIHETDSWQAWFKSIPNDAYLNPPIKGYEKLINTLKGN